MANETESTDDLAVLRSKRDSTRYQILVEIASRQPAVSQQEIADAIGVTAQAVSDYLGELVERGHVRKHGRGRYEVTNEGVDWVISRTENLREFVEFVSEEVIGGVEVETAVATDAIQDGDRVEMTMRDGVPHASPGADGGATAVAITDARADEDVGVTDFEGIWELEQGTVTVLVVPSVVEGGSRAVDLDLVAELATDVDLFAAAGTEALVAARRADREPDLRFGVGPAVREAAHKGLDVFLVASTTRLSSVTSTLRDGDVAYDLIDERT